MLPAVTDPALPSLPVLHLDAALIVVRKPAGLLSVPGRGEAGRDCVLHRLQQAHPEALIVHRLDQATSGLLVLARDAASHRRLSMDFEARRVEKRYEAVVAGTPQAASGSIDLPLACDWPNRPRQQVDHARGKPSLTHWQRLERGCSSAPGERLSLTPVTGRSHQLRVHLATIGHPIVGDTLYAPAPWDRASTRLLLHATWLRLPHPLHGGFIEFADPAPF
jgi:tRNA pseudouridine32 synthase/23S rRNA pseudouridine746 synthase